MVDEVRVLRRLRAISNESDVLRREVDADDDRRADSLWLRGIKYSFITAVEAIVDVAQHVCATEGWGPPADNGDALRLLGAHGAISLVLADSLRRAVGFRNVLVHEYVAVDDAIVLARLRDLSDFEAYTRDLATYVAAH